MALQANNIITYGDVVNKIINVIVNLCDNIDSFKSNVLNYQKNRASYVLAVDTVGASTQARVLRTVNDARCEVVLKSVVTSQLNSFLSQRGVLSQKNDIISFKGLLNLCNNAVIFMNYKLLILNDSISRNTVVFYNKNNVAYPSFTNYSSLDLSSSNIAYTTTNLLNSLKNINKVSVINTTTTYTCSSSSSSSSSSCSSSSSSSSAFIVYMNI